MKIPGFRTRTPWKMALASFFYTLVLGFIVIAIIDPSPAPPPVELTVEPSINDHTLVLSGTTNLPNGALIMWEVSPKEYKEQFNFDMVQNGIATVTNGKWQASVPSHAFPKGRLEIWVGFQTVLGEKEEQPPEIIALYGQAGEKIKGPLAVKAGYITRAEITKYINWPLSDTKS